MRKCPIRLHLGSFREGRKPQKPKQKTAKKEEKSPDSKEIEAVLPNC